MATCANADAFFLVALNWTVIFGFSGYLIIGLIVGLAVSTDFRVEGYRDAGN